jgi:1-acyl-sn-glycerol-3-phosphate acyltransferase
MLRKYVRTGGRFIHFCTTITMAGASYFFTVWLRGRSDRNAPRAGWMARYARRVLASLNIEVACHGTPPRHGLLAANHLGYIDIIVLGSVQPTIFLSKSEVRHWPIFGFLAACAGTLFIRRDKKSDVARFDEAFARVVDEGVLLAIFPEGTSTDGHKVLPFHSSLFAAAAANHWPVTPVWLGYEADGGSVETEVCYWGDMTFFAHFRKLITLSKIKATVVYGETLPPGLDRKHIAKQLHRNVCQLAEHHRPGSITPTADVPAVPCPAGATAPSSSGRPDAPLTPE